MLETMSLQLCFGNGSLKSCSSPGQGGAGVLCVARMLGCPREAGAVCHLCFRVPCLEDVMWLANMWDKPYCVFLWLYFFSFGFVTD